MTVRVLAYHATKQRAATHLRRIVGDVANCRIKRTNRAIHHAWQMTGVCCFEQFA